MGETPTRCPTCSASSRDDQDCGGVGPICTDPWHRLMGETPTPLDDATRPPEQIGWYNPDDGTLLPMSEAEWVHCYRVLEPVYRSEARS